MSNQRSPFGMDGTCRTRTRRTGHLAVPGHVLRAGWSLPSRRSSALHRTSSGRSSSSESACCSILRARGGGWAPSGRKLYRSRDDRMIAGVLGGVAKWLGVNPTPLRVVYVILTVLHRLLARASSPTSSRRSCSPRSPGTRRGLRRRRAAARAPPRLPAPPAPAAPAAPPSRRRTPSSPPSRPQPRRAAGPRPPASPPSPPASRRAPSCPARPARAAGAARVLGPRRRMARDE